MPEFIQSLDKYLLRVCQEEGGCFEWEGERDRGGCGLRQRAGGAEQLQGWGVVVGRETLLTSSAGVGELGPPASAVGSPGPFLPNS